MKITSYFEINGITFVKDSEGKIYFLEKINETEIESLNINSQEDNISTLTYSPEIEDNEVPNPSEPDIEETTEKPDTRTEIKIQQAFGKMMQGRTSFIVAHRLSTIKNADVILAMKDGKIVEQGSHAELMEKNGFYAELYNSRLDTTA